MSTICCSFLWILIYKTHYREVAKYPQAVHITWHLQEGGRGFLLECSCVKYAALTTVPLIALPVEGAKIITSTTKPPGGYTTSSRLSRCTFDTAVRFSLALFRSCPMIPHNKTLAVSHNTTNDAVIKRDVRARCWSRWFRPANPTTHPTAHTGMRFLSVVSCFGHAWSRRHTVRRRFCSNLLCWPASILRYVTSQQSTVCSQRQSLLSSFPDKHFWLMFLLLLV